MSRNRNIKKTSKNDAKIVKYTRQLTLFTLLLFIATLALASIAYLQYNVDLKMSEITSDFYTYHSPDASVIDGYVTNLYVLNNNSTKMYISVVGLASVYNSALSDDVALVKKMNLRKNYKPFNDEIIMIASIVDMGTGEVLQRQEIPYVRNGTVNVEGNIFPISINSGESEYIPILISYVRETPFEENNTIDLEIDTNVTQLEVIHPTNKTILYTMTAFSPINITYIMGKDTAIVKVDNHTSYNANVRYTEDENTYRDWKYKFLLQYGEGAFVV